MTSLQNQLAGLYQLDPQLQGMFRGHIRQFPGDAAELAQELGVSFCEAAGNDSMATIFNRARARVRRFGCGVAGGRTCISLDAMQQELADHDDDAGKEAELFVYVQYDDDDEGNRKQPASWRRADVVRWVAETHRVSEQHARTLVDEAIRRRKENGDLFGEDE